jgi:NACHT domain
MSAGRPPKNPTEALPELAELRAWLAAALAGAGYDNVHQFLAHNKQFAGNQVYDLRNGTRYLDLPVMKALASALGRPPGEVEPLWFSAKRAIEHNEQLHAAMARRPRSWETLPQPEPGVRYLLLAEADEAQLLPYQLLGIEPPSLPLIYVRQYLRDWLSGPQATDEPGDLVGGTAREEEVRPAAEVLSRHDYVLVTGGPGSGKTALVRELARRLARIWLREDPASDPPTAQPAVPLLIPARALTDAGSFTSALAAAVRKVYGMDMLTELRPLHFAGPASGSRWLLIIDGLDEIVDRELRVKIIRAIRGHARADTPYRFVVTSRPLPEAELRSLRQEPFTAVSVEPFGRRELRKFAEKWFTTQNPATASEQSRSFVREISDPRLREAARNPLLATIAAVAKTRDPGLPLPASRVDLYERFCGFLIGDEANGRTTLAQIRQRTGEPGYRAAEWVYGHREEIVTWLAERYLGGEPALLDAARAWIRDNLPADIGESPKADDLRLLLAGTGVLMAEGDDLRFTHHTLAEYLAAQAMARRMTADLTGQPSLKAMIDRGLGDAQETFVVFTLVLWGRTGGDLGGLLRHLLDGPPRQSLLAGRILGECGDARPAEASQVIDRLMDMALGNAGVVFRDDFGDDPLRRRGEQDPDPLAAAPGEAFWHLGYIHGASHVATVLRSVAASGELAVETRTDAAVALGRNSDSDGAIEILQSLPQDHTPLVVRVRIAEAIISLNPDATDAAEAVLRTMNTGTGSPGPAVRAAELLAEFGQPEQAVDLAWSVIDDNGGAYPAQTVSAIRSILRYQGADGAARLLHVAAGQLRKGRPMLRWILIELTQWGFSDQVIEFCRQALADPDTIQWQWSSVAGGWAFAAGPSAITEIFCVLDERGTPYKEAAGEVSLRLLETGHPDEAFEIAMGLMQSPGEHLGYSHVPWIALAAAPSERLPEVLSLIDQVSVSDDVDGRRVLDELIRLGETGRALSKAKALVLGSHSLSRRAGPTMVKALRASGEPEALAEELVRAVAAESYTGRRVPIIETLLDIGDARHAAEMAREVIANQTVLGNDLARMARVLLLSEGLHAADDIVALLRAREERLEYKHLPGVKAKHLLEIADCLASVGALAVGTRLWLELLTSFSAPIVESFASCSSLVQSGQRTLAITTLRNKLNDGNLPAADRARLGALLSWTELRNSQATSAASAPDSC